MSISRQQRRAAMRDMKKVKGELFCGDVLAAIDECSPSLATRGLTSNDVLDMFLMAHGFVDPEDLDDDTMDRASRFIDEVMAPAFADDEGDEDADPTFYAPDLSNFPIIPGESMEDYMSRMNDVWMQQRVDAGAIAVTLDEFDKLDRTKMVEGQRYIITDSLITSGAST